MTGPSPRRILILKPSALGDIVHTLPVLGALRSHWPQAHLSWVVNHTFRGLLDGHPALDAVLPLDRGLFRRGLTTAARAGWLFLESLRRGHYDLLLDFQGLLRTGIMAAYSGVPTRVGFAAAREGARWAYTHRIRLPHEAQLHAVDRYLGLLRAIGVPAGPPRWIVPVDPAERAAAQECLTSLPRPWVAVALGAKWQTKRWPPEHFLALLQQQAQLCGGSVLFIGTRDDAPLVAAVRPQLSLPTLDLTGQTSVPRLIALLALADVMLGNDTGPLHLAAALGTPCVAPFTCTRIERHGPYGYQSLAVATTVPCAGSYLRVCPRGTICFDDLQPQRLLPSWRKALAPWIAR